MSLGRHLIVFYLVQNNQNICMPRGVDISHTITISIDLILLFFLEAKLTSRNYRDLTNPRSSYMARFRDKALQTQIVSIHGTRI